MREIDVRSSFKQDYKNVKKLYEECDKEMDRMKKENKTKTITFRETMGKKGFYAKLLSLYGDYGIEDVE